MRIPMRAGFTLVEVLVALVLIDVGVLALVANASVLARRQNALRLQRAASRAAANRLQELAAAPCVAAMGTSAGETGITEYWSAAAPVNGTRNLADSVVFALAGQRHDVVLRTSVPC